ncbi:uncharacterized protein TNIN_83071 [Trichonephila inaurata madagascariensis]|uniref:Uncharacterized protein n=1 Tax=Trichonephila inaurata madagascariensis TaxID=2747483 RepID=A0A8X6XX02_9ARAC|nr:uncharacterized protein TNIN_83071 [Trichonephila inaurata madagascariensis]
MQFPDSKSDDDSDFPEISLTELLEDMKKKNTQQNTQKETATESRIIPNSKFQYDVTTLFDKESQGLSHNRIQPSKILPREPPKRKFIDAVHSSKSKRVRLDIPPNAKRKHKDDSKSNCEKPIKKTRCDSPQIKEFENNPATYDQSELHDPFQNNSFDKTKEKALFIIMDGTLIIGCTPLILFIIIGWFICRKRRKPQLRSSLVIAECLQPQVACRSVPCQHPYYRGISEYSAQKAPQKNVLSIEKVRIGSPVPIICAFLRGTLLHAMNRPASSQHDLPLEKILWSGNFKELMGRWYATWI